MKIISHKIVTLSFLFITSIYSYSEGSCIVRSGSLDSIFGVKLGDEISFSSACYDVVEKKIFFDEFYIYTIKPKKSSKLFESVKAMTSCENGKIYKLFSKSKLGLSCEDYFDYFFYSVNLKTMNININKNEKSLVATKKYNGGIGVLDVSCRGVRDGKKIFSINLSNNTYEEECK